MNISQNGLEFIKKYEGFQSKPYLCPARKLTIGYGHVISPHEQFNTAITEKDAERILASDLKVTETTIAKGVIVPLTQGKYDALVSLVYNWGGGNFLRSLGLRCLNNSDYKKAAEEMGMWIAQGKLKSKEDIYNGIENFQETYARLFNGNKKGKLVLKVIED